MLVMLSIRCTGMYYRGWKGSAGVAEVLDIPSLARQQRVAEL